MKTTKVVGFVASLAALAWMAGCNGSTGGCGGGVTSASCPATPTPPPVLPAAVTAVGSGSLVLHPSTDSRFTWALEAPIRITETGGGNAVWEFARMSIFRKGAEVERYELGSDVIQKAGYSQIGTKSDKVYSVVFRQNTEDFDRVDITLGFGDLKDSRQFTAAVPFNSFADVTLSLTAMAVPAGGTVKLPGQ